MVECETERDVAECAGVVMVECEGVRDVAECVDECVDESEEEAGSVAEREEAGVVACERVGVVD